MTVLIDDEYGRTGALDGTMPDVGPDAWVAYYLLDTDGAAVQIPYMGTSDTDGIVGLLPHPAPAGEVTITTVSTLSSYVGPYRQGSTTVVRRSDSPTVDGARWFCVTPVTIDGAPGTLYAFLSLHYEDRTFIASLFPSVAEAFSGTTVETEVIDHDDGTISVWVEGSLVADHWTAEGFALPARDHVGISGLGQILGAYSPATAVESFKVEGTGGGGGDPDDASIPEQADPAPLLLIPNDDGAISAEGIVSIGDPVDTGGLALVGDGGYLRVEADGLISFLAHAQPMLLIPTPGTATVEAQIVLTGNVEDVVSSGAIVLHPEPGMVTVEPAAAAPPAHAEIVNYRQVWERYTTSPVLVDGTLDSDWEPTSAGDAEWGRLRLVIGGVDVTFTGGLPVDFGAITEEDPFGYGPMTVRLPGIPVAGPKPGWLRPGALAKVERVLPDGTVGVTVWEGQVKVIRAKQTPRRTGVPAGRAATVVDLVGTLGVADLQIDTPERLPRRADLGRKTTRELTQVANRRYRVTGVETPGLFTITRGEWQAKIKGRVAGLLAESLRVTGDQLTVQTYPNRDVRVEWRDRTTVAAECWVDQPGVDVELEEDVEQQCNRLFVEFVAPDGCRYQGWRYPLFGGFRPLAYPFNDEDDMISVGTRDVDTDSGRGVSDWKKRMRDEHVRGLDYKMIRTFTSADEKRLKRLQRHWGLDLIDGILGPQTWTASFAATWDGASFEGARIHPMIQDPRVDPWIYNPDGVKLRANPAWDPSIPVIDHYLNLGSGVTTDEAEEAADAYWARCQTRILAGRITLKGMDLTTPAGVPVSRFELRAGQNILVRGFDGDETGVVVHIGRKEIAGTTVTLDVDSAARDYVNLLEQRARDRTAFAGPRVRNDSQLGASISTPYDCESGAGEFRMTVLGGHWQVVPVPLSEWGDVVRTEIIADERTRMAAYVFANRITVADLARVIPKPLKAGARKKAQETLVAKYRRLVGWGDDAKAGGFGFGCDAAGEPGDTTQPIGAIKDDGTWSFAGLEHAPVAWLAVWCESSCEVTGKLYVAAK